jgi:oligopeptide/dipeptide ABC transporter ATP-binding protein
MGMAIMLITHDLGVIAEIAQRVVVMYAGKVVEEADTAALFRRRLHPYTEGLLNSIPRLDDDQTSLPVIKGMVPNPLRMPSGCRFHPRCPLVRDICRAKEPALSAVETGHSVACWLYQGSKEDGI